MTKIQQWIAELEEQGVMIALVDGQLQIDAPNELLVPELVDQLKARRQELIDALDDPSANAIPVLSDDVRSAPMQLSFAQERLWFLDEFESGSSLYNIPLCVRLSGRLDIEALTLAIEQLVARHEVLRTRIVKDATDNARQLITTAVPELVHKSISAEDHVLEELQITEASMPFDLSDSLKIRFTLADVQACDNEHVLLVTMHHIASDGWSIDILVAELAELYAAALAKRPTVLPELAVQYADFGAWQRTWLSSGELENQTDYWRNQLKGAPALIDLPTDRPRPGTQRFEGRTLEFALPDKLGLDLQTLSNSSGATLYMTLLTAFNVLLNRYGAGDDIVIGSPIANRTREDTEPLIGFFANAIVLRSDLSGAPSFLDVLKQVRDTTLSAFEYQDAPFEKLVEELKPERSTSYSPLFQVMFLLQNQPASSMTMPGLSIEPVNVSNSTAKFDLTLAMQDSGSSLSGWIEYNIDLFDDSTIKRMSRHFVSLLESIVSQPGDAIAKLPLMDESEKDYFLTELNASEQDYPSDKTVADLFVEKAQQCPDATAVIGPDNQQLSFGQLDAQSNQVARYLQSVGIEPGDRIGVYLERSVDMLSTLLGVMKSGALYVPMDPIFPADRLAFMANDACLKLVVTQQVLLDSVPSDQCQLLVLDKLDDAFTETSDAPLQLAVPDAPVYIIYTSGSTGQPKGVQVGHRALTNFLYSMLANPGFSSKDRLLSVTTLSFDIAALELYAPLLAGGSVIIASREEAMDPEKLAARLSDSSCTTMQATPATWKMLLEWGWQGSQSTRVLCGGEPLSRDLADGLLSKCGEVWNLYGPTETTIWSTLSQIVGDEKDITVGQAIANTQLYVLDTQRQLVPIGVPGELYIGGAGVADGYLNREELTNERFVDNPFDTQGKTRLYRTGDGARWRADGRLEIHGRLDDQVKLRGYRIEPGEIRAVLVQQASIDDAVVVVREHEPGKHQLVAYMVIDPSRHADLDIASLRSTLSSVMPDYMIPNAWVIVDSLPLTPNGKVDRKALLSSELSETAAEEYQPPQSETEQALARIWAEVLSVSSVSRTDSFFALGGHSLKAVQVVSRVRDKLALELPLKIVFERPSLVEMSEAIDVLLRSTKASEFEDLAEGEVQYNF